MLRAFELFALLFGLRYLARRELLILSVSSSRFCALCVLCDPSRAANVLVAIVLCLFVGADVW